MDKVEQHLVEIEERLTRFPHAAQAADGLTLIALVRKQREAIANMRGSIRVHLSDDHPPCTICGGFVSRLDEALDYNPFSDDQRRRDGVVQQPCGKEPRLDCVSLLAAVLAMALRGDGRKGGGGMRQTTRELVQAVGRLHNEVQVTEDAAIAASGMARDVVLIHQTLHVLLDELEAAQKEIERLRLADQAWMAGFVANQGSINPHSKPSHTDPDRRFYEWLDGYERAEADRERDQALAQRDKLREAVKDHRCDDFWVWDLDPLGECGLCHLLAAQEGSEK